MVTTDEYLIEKIYLSIIKYFILIILFSKIKLKSVANMMVKKIIQRTQNIIELI